MTTDSDIIYVPGVEAPHYGYAKRLDAVALKYLQAFHAEWCYIGGSDGGSFMKTSTARVISRRLDLSHAKANMVPIQAVRNYYAHALLVVLSGVTAARHLNIVDVWLSWPGSADHKFLSLGEFADSVRGDAA